MSFEDRFCATAEEDLDRLFDFFLDGTKTIEDIDLAGAAIEADRLVLCTLHPVDRDALHLAQGRQKSDSAGTDRSVRCYRVRGTF